MTTTAYSNAFFRDPADHRWLSPFPGEFVAHHVNGQQTGQNFSCAEAEIEPGVGQPLHIHHTIEELLYVLEGEITFALEGRRFRSGPGGVLFIPRGSAHAFRNFGNRPARMLGVFSPSAMDGFFEAMEGQLPSALPEIARRYGIEFVGPMIEAEPA
ncbi:cupin domain-containing protein [Belnapia sp. T18]|uniref:Cupin domain-containing protein n=1 Tax=Belnapia arida TaxID=2804533 RepID=A0ABS1U9J5_9PROT|nr:cupin domain-containing protein [Belnapia arida]MBL6081362.1 cupin domain-containing protein [Belnapia arida]